MLFKSGKGVEVSVKFLRRRKALELFILLEDRLFFSDYEWIFEFHLLFINHNITEVHSPVLFFYLLDIIQSLGDSGHNILDFILTESLVLDPAMRQIFFKRCPSPKGQIQLRLASTRREIIVVPVVVKRNEKRRRFGSPYLDTI